jgi:hypothetical protein
MRKKTFLGAELKTDGVGAKKKLISAIEFSTKDKFNEWQNT